MKNPIPNTQFPKRISKDPVSANILPEYWPSVTNLRRTLFSFSFYYCSLLKIYFHLGPFHLLFQSTAKLFLIESLTNHLMDIWSGLVKGGDWKIQVIPSNGKLKYFNLSAVGRMKDQLVYMTAHCADMSLKYNYWHHSTPVSIIVVIGDTRGSLYHEHHCYVITNESKKRTCMLNSEFIVEAKFFWNHPKVLFVCLLVCFLLGKQSCGKMWEQIKIKHSSEA